VGEAERDEGRHEEDAAADPEEAGQHSRGDAEKSGDDSAARVERRL
jgi:hypothetical protein